MRASGEYDSLGQMTRVNDPAEGTTRVYRYDLGGNMVSHAKYAYTTGALGTAQGETAYSYGTAGWKDRLTALGNKALGYDAIGNLTSYNGWTYEWEAGRQLKRQVKSSGTDVKYEYDQNGMRVRKTVNGTATNYTYNGSRLVHLTTGSNKLHFYYDAQGKPALVNYNGTQYSYLYNLQGDVIGLVDSAGALVVEYKYNAWGSITGRAGSLAATLGKLNPFRYRGYVYDEETWMYWLKSRYYYPEMQRFISADVVVGKIGSVNGHNLYAYCGNEPVACYDSNGYAVVCCFDDNGLEVSLIAHALYGGGGGGMTAGNVYAYAESPHHKNGGTIEEACGALLLDAVVMGRACRNEAAIKNRQPISRMYIKSDFTLSEFYQEIIEDELNVKEVVFTDDVRDFTSYTFKPQLRTVGPKYGKQLGGIQKHLAALDGNAAMDELNADGALKFDVDGVAVELTKDDLLIDMAQKEGYVSQEDNRMTVVLDTNLTPELVEEGFVYEIISKIQTMRKESGFEVTDHIRVSINGNDKLSEIAQKNKEAISGKVLADELTSGMEYGVSKEWNINGENAVIAVERV